MNIVYEAVSLDFLLPCTCLHTQSRPPRLDILPKNRVSYRCKQFWTLFTTECRVMVILIVMVIVG